MPSAIASRRRRSISANHPTPTTLQTLSTSPHHIMALAWSPSGHYLAVSLQHGTILIFSTQSSSTTLLRSVPTRVLKGHTADVNHLCFSTSNLLVSASMDRSVRLWQPATGICLRRLSHDEKVVSAAFDPADPSVLLTATTDGQARLVRVSDRTILARADAETPLQGAALLPAREATSAAVLATRDGRLLTWRPQIAVATPAERLPEIPLEPRRSAMSRRERPVANAASVTALPGGRVLMSSGMRRAELCMSGITGRVRASGSRRGAALAPGMTPDGRFSLLDASGGALRVVDGAVSHRAPGESSRETRGTAVEVPVFGRANVCCAAFAPDAVLKRVAKQSGPTCFLLAVGGSNCTIALIKQSFH